MRILKVLLLTFLSCAPTALFAADRPNVIIVMSDDQGYGELSCHGNPILKTPHLDHLASESLRLTDFHVAPMCTPTRGQLLTGLDSFRNGAMNVSSGRSLLRPELKTMADYFKQAGYRTGIFGKWHLGDNYPFRPEDRGFDETIWFPSSHINSVPDFWNNDYFEDTYIHNGKRKKYQGYCTDVFFREAMNWIKKDRTKPFLAYIPLNAAHWPHFVPDQYREPIRKAMEANPGVVSKLYKKQKAALVSFLAMCANIDDNVGRLNGFLDRQSLSKNTILIFLTDNGSTMGPLYFNAGMKGKKVTLWEGGHRVPCFIRWPNGKFGKPRDISDLAHVQDLLPTLLDVCDVKAETPKFDGISLAPRFRNEVSKIEDRMLVINYSRMPHRNKSINLTLPNKAGAAVLWKHWRLLEEKELYDLRNDPKQENDVFNKHPEVVSKMQSHLDQWWNNLKDDAATPQRVIIGSDHENPMMITACEWLDVFVDQQIQVRRATKKNGTWHLTVAQDGNYEFELRRWPRESGLKLAEGCSKLKVTDGEFVEGNSFPIARATFRIDAETESSLQTSSETENGESIHFKAELKKGPIQLRTTFLDKEGKEIVGAYYVYIKRTE